MFISDYIYQHLYPDHMTLAFYLITYTNIHTWSHDTTIYTWLFDTNICKSNLSNTDHKETQN